MQDARYKIRDTRYGMRDAGCNSTLFVVSASALPRSVEALATNDRLVQVKNNATTGKNKDLGNGQVSEAVRDCRFFCHFERSIAK